MKYVLGVSTIHAESPERAAEMYCKMVNCGHGDRFTMTDEDGAVYMFRLVLELVEVQGGKDEDTADGY